MKEVYFFIKYLPSKFTMLYYMELIKCCQFRYEEKYSNLGVLQAMLLASDISNSEFCTSACELLVTAAQCKQDITEAENIIRVSLSQAI